MASREQVELDGERVDRVFLHRATEHVLAKRILSNRECTGLVKSLLHQIRNENWVESPYGIEQDNTDDDDVVKFDERGVHSRYFLKNTVSDQAVKDLTHKLIERRHRAGRKSIFDVYASDQTCGLEKIRQNDSKKVVES